MQTTSTSRTTRTATRRRRFGVLVVGGAAALTLGLGACSGGDTGGAAAPASSSAATQRTAFEVVQASADKSAQAGSAKFSLSLTSQAQGQTVDVTGDGAFDAETGAFEMTMTLPPEAGATKVVLRFVDGSVFFSGAPLTGEGQWVELPAEAAGQMGFDSAEMDPSKQLQQLKSVADDVTEVPGVTVRGVETTGYAGTIDPQKALAQLPAEEQTEEAKQAAAQTGPIPFTLYVDDQDRPARMVLDVTAEGATAKVSMDFYDWGSDVDVAAPDPSTVTQAPAGLGGQPAAA